MGELRVVQIWNDDDTALGRANPSRDSALADAGFDLDVNRTVTVFADYEVQAGQSLRMPWVATLGQPIVFVFHVVYKPT
jgi:hypothetical protein